MELHGASIEFHGIPWNSMKLHGILWNSMEFHGIPWSYFTRVTNVASIFKLHVNTTDKFSIILPNCILKKIIKKAKNDSGIPHDRQLFQ